MIRLRWEPVKKIVQFKWVWVKIPHGLDDNYFPRFIARIRFIFTIIANNGEVNGFPFYTIENTECIKSIPITRQVIRMRVLNVCVNWTTTKSQSFGTYKLPSGKPIGNDSEVTDFISILNTRTVGRFYMKTLTACTERFPRSGNLTNAIARVFFNICM